jgi:mRNA-degrading endonuclease toxin of MazEF toxin-antitoxin module
MRAGDVVEVDFGDPEGSEAGFVRPAIIVTADLVLDGGPRTIHVIPLTSNARRGLPAEVLVEAEGLGRPSAAQCHLCTAISTSRITTPPRVNVGPVPLAQVRAVLADLLDL